VPRYEPIVPERLESWSHWLTQHPRTSTALGIGVLLLAAVLSYFVTHRYFLRLITRIVRKTEFKWDDALLESNVMRHAASTAPWLVIYFGEPLVPNVPAKLHTFLARGAMVLLVASATLMLNSFLTAINTVYARHPIAKDRPIKGYLQVVKLFVFALGGVSIVAVAFNKSPLGFLAGVGAATAVLLLIFRDTILSLVASIQIASNDMVRIGDWIEMPKYGADGDVIDVALHTIKVQNWDKTITTIPTYKLIEDSFKNWRGMSESGGRRIKRSLFVDMTSVRFLSDEEVDRFGRYELLSEYIKDKKAAIAEHNQGKVGVLENDARRLTNLGTFRHYLLEYLERNPNIHPASEMTLLVRQLQPGPDGIPIEIYAFSKDTRWARYEDIQSDIMDHVLAVVPDFGLRVFQNPTGKDLQALSTRK
jgi:miniconductance mechanosensitive channel